jgi:hypothetical protein
MSKSHTTWKEFPLAYTTQWKIMVNHFYNVHQAHVIRVNNNMELMVNHYRHISPVYAELQERLYVHDLSKLQEPEFTPYVWRIWRTRWRANNHEANMMDMSPYFKDQSLDQSIQDAVRYHITHNRHHPEWHMDSDDMSQVDIIEMVCDWYAMSQEFNSSIDLWFNDVVPRRYNFGKKKPVVWQNIELIKQLAGDKSYDV